LSGGRGDVSRAIERERGAGPVRIAGQGGRDPVSDERAERGRVLAAAQSWSEGLSTAHPDRPFSAVAMDLLRRPRLLCEFIGPQAPPPAPGTEGPAKKRARRRRREERRGAEAARRRALAGVQGREDEALVAGAAGGGEGEGEDRGKGQGAGASESKVGGNEEEEDGRGEDGA
jgi:hypothetical protein